MYNMEYNQDKNYKYLYQKYKKKYLNLKRNIFGGNDLNYSLILDKDVIIPKDQIDEMYYESDTTYNQLKQGIITYFKKFYKFDINTTEISFKSKNKKNQRIKKIQNSELDNFIEDGIDILVELKKKPVDVISLGLSDKSIKMKSGFDLIDDFSIINGRRYKGEIKDGLPNGKGIGFNSYGFEYNGEWLNGLPHGKGKETRNDGSTYDGDWSGGIPNGKGIQILSNGSTYEGDWVNGKFNGFGTYIEKDKFIQEGNWTNNFPNGKSKVTFFDGYSYDGDFIMGVKDGSGTEILPEGNENMEYEYIGQFKNNLRNGKGKMTYYDGLIYEGDWVNNTWHGQGTIVDKELEITFVGNFVNGEKDGNGIEYYNNGNKLEGYYNNGKKDGKFDLTDVQGQITELFFVNDNKVSPESYKKYMKDSLEKFTLSYLLTQEPDEPYSDEEDYLMGTGQSIARDPSEQDELDENMTAKNILERINSN